MKKFVHNHKIFSLNIFIIASVSIFYLNTAKINRAFWGYNTNTEITQDGCYTTETTYRTYYRLWLPTKDSSITDIKINDSKCY
jgi:hypothetical protein